MADIAKLKKKAADFEAKKQADKALATYREMIEVYERGEEDPIDIPLYNRVGDLLQKAGNLAEAVSIWERAVDHYAEGGFYNPAIALCNKILRQSPGRTVVYYKLGKISAEKGFKADARQNFLEYASRMQKSGNLDEAFRALKEFADLVPDQDDVRLMLADQLAKAGRKDEAIEQFQVAYALALRLGKAEDAESIADRMKAVDPSVVPKADEAGGAGQGRGGLVFLDIDPAPGPKRTTIRTASPNDAKRMSRAIAGLEILETGAIPAVEPPAVSGRASRAAGPPLPAPAAPTTAKAPDLIIEPPSSAGPPATKPVADGGLIIEPTSINFGSIDPGSAGLLGLESTSLAEPTPPATPELPPVEPPSAAPPALPLLDIETPVPAAEEAAVVKPTAEFVELAPAAEPVDESAAALGDFGAFGTPASTESFDLLEVETSEGVHALPLEPGYVQEPQSLVEPPSAPLLPPIAAADEGIVLPAARATSSVLANSVDLLLAQVEGAPEDWSLRRQYAEALLDGGQRDAGVRELEAALAGFEGSGDLDTAASVAEEIVRLAPTVIKYHQKRVEYAFRANDRMRLAEAYVELGDALLKDGQGPKAKIVYQRVLEIAPDDLRAQAALETIKDEPAPAAPPPRRSTTAVKKPVAPVSTPAASAKPTPKKPADDEFVSLGDWLRDEDEPKSTRMVVEEKEPTGDEKADFNDMLRKFKQGVSENVEEEDHEAHYDLGVAYKEMGLLDEAISEFQKALRGPSNRVRAIEALGQCFVEKQQLPVAATILGRALNEPGIGDEALIGVLYLLGTISEELHLFPDAKKYYQRVFAVDIQFRDVADRLNVVEKKS